ncbi:pathogenicity island protein [Staphylococcus pettenkoferi]|uniref:helix-turn-helix transcriptional regulator n=1 Tax=Staphylococcus pettenkoferi TaxID=170573 RepID=UPI000F5327E3|nr:helix-turn-helix transcriptional regulator [Staphylococcus pettenkoferi]RQM94287.1 pathogenicity island protein [Staphylococcus pettenkoferi]
MTATDKKKMLKEKYLKPKTKLRKLRLSEEFTTEYVASLIGLQRRQYEQKEQGKYPFNDYEMEILAKTFDVSVEDIFLIINIT